MYNSINRIFIHQFKKKVIMNVSNFFSRHMKSCVKRPKIQKSAMEYHLQNTWRILCEENDTREFGKFMAPIVERSIVPLWLTNNGFASQPAPRDSEGQQEKYDIVVDGRIRVQVKFRAGKCKSGRYKLHLENTRRSTGKNADNGAKNGQVRSGIHDSDVHLFVVPTGEIWEQEKFRFLVIPTVELEDNSMKGYCCSRVNAKVMDKWNNIDGIETLRSFL